MKNQNKTNTYKILIPSLIGVGIILSSCVSSQKSSKTPAQSPNIPQDTASRVIVNNVKIQETTPSSKPQYQPAVPAQPAQQYRSFYDWKMDFDRRANNSTLSTLLSGATYSQNVVSLDSSQAEFTKMVWSYLDSAVSASRVSQARTKRQEMINTLTHAENTYGVPASIVTAIWGLESSFGAGMGRMDLVSSLSSLAYDGRRRAFAENELVAMAKMIERGDISQYDLKGSWAGGMGHTQFIPSTWLAQGVDADGDGRKNPFTKVDSLTTTASYLANAGWVRGLPAYIEVALPQNFDYRYIGQTMSLDNWRSMGLMPMDNEYLGGAETAELFLPAGINGPKLLTTKNFSVIKVYNNSSNYALAVAMLANKMNGKAGIVASFPRNEQGLSKYQIQKLQQTLTAQGYDTKGVDGVAGVNTRAAFARWQSANGQIPDGFITQNSAASLIY